MATIKESVDLFEDEMIVREYHAIDTQYVPLLSSGGEGRIAITNRRVIGRSELKVSGGQRVEFNAVPLNTVQGTCLTAGNTTSWRRIIGGVIGVGLGVWMLTYELWPGVLLLLAGIAAIAFAFRKEIKIGIRAATIVRGGRVSEAEPEGYLLLSKSGFSAFKIHGPDVDAVMRSLDAVILAVQQRGTEVIRDLKCPNEECGYMTMIDEAPPKHCPECGKAWKKK